MRKNTSAKCFTGIALTAAICSILALTSCAGFGAYKRKVADIRITMENFYGIPAGTYNGEYDAVLVAAKVQVTVQPEGMVQDIKLLEHKNGRGAKAEVVISKVVKNQTLLVDTVSGATNSSKVILKAVQNALEGAR